MSLENQKPNIPHNDLSNLISDSKEHDNVEESIESFNSEDLGTELITKEPVRYELDYKQKKQGIDLCNKFVDDLLALHLPKRILEQDEIIQVVAMQQAMERFTLSSMFRIVQQAIKILDDLDISSIYDEIGSVDFHRLQGFMNLQGHVMRVVADFNLHVRQLPGVLRGVIIDAENHNAVVINAGTNPNSQEQNLSNTPGTYIVSKQPLNVLMLEAERELRESGKDDYDGIDEDHAGITKNRINTGETDANGNIIFRYIVPEEELEDEKDNLENVFDNE